MYSRSQFQTCSHIPHYLTSSVHKDEIVISTHTRNVLLTYIRTHAHTIHMHLSECVVLIHSFLWLLCPEQLYQTYKFNLAKPRVQHFVYIWYSVFFSHCFLLFYSHFFSFWVFFAITTNPTWIWFCMLFTMNYDSNPRNAELSIFFSSLVRFICVYI